MNAICLRFVLEIVVNAQQMFIRKMEAPVELVQAEWKKLLVRFKCFTRKFNSENQRMKMFLFIRILLQWNLSDIKCTMRKDLGLWWLCCRQTML